MAVLGLGGAIHPLLALGFSCGTSHPQNEMINLSKAVHIQEGNFQPILWRVEYHVLVACHFPPQQLTIAETFWDEPPTKHHVYPFLSFMVLPGPGTVFVSLSFSTQIPRFMVKHFLCCWVFWSSMIFDGPIHLLDEIILRRILNHHFSLLNHHVFFVKSLHFSRLSYYIMYIYVCVFFHD